MPRKPPPPPRPLQDQFVNNVSRYPLYLVTVLLGGIWVGVKPLVDLYRQSPAMAVVVGTGVSVGLFLLYCTLRGMSGDTFFPWMS
ncbi:MAG: DUF751 domain-containing protein [Thermostichales cyanobacterium SZTDM-1c_bins_54]